VYCALIWAYKARFLKRERLLAYREEERSSHIRGYGIYFSYG
jgi:hypothetical protein